VPFPRAPGARRIGSMAVWLRVRSELRTRWRAALSLALLVGISGGVVMAAWAGARRTHTAYTRFVVAQNAWDAAVSNDQSFGVTAEQIDAIERLPEVKTAVRGIVDYADLGVGVPFFATDDPRVGTTFNQYKLVEGRRADPRRVDEVLVSFAAADRYGVEVGDEIGLTFEGDKARVVGIEASPGEFPPQTVGLAPAIHPTPAFFRMISRRVDEDGNPPKESLLLQVRRGTDLDAFRRKVVRISPEGFVLLQPDMTASTQRSFRLQSMALWLLGALTAFVGVLTLSQAVARQVLIDAREDRTLGAVGMTRAQRFAIRLARAGMIGVGGGVIALLLAIALSPLTPVGLARIAEPDPGLRIDGFVLGLGVLVTILAAPLLALVPAWRAQGRFESDAGRRSKLADTLSRWGLPVTTVTGARLALEPGRGRTAVPVKTTLATAVVAVAAVAAAFTFGASLDRLISTPRLFGQTWDTAFTTFGESNLLPEGNAVLERDPAVADFSIGAFGDITVDGQSVGVVALDLTHRSVVPPVIGGRAPERVGEIALGTRTLEKLDKRIGETVRVAVQDSPELTMRIVGRSVTPLFFGEARLGEGALVSIDNVIPGEEEVEASEAVVRWTPDATLADKRRAQAALAEVAGRTLVELPPEKPTDIVNFGRVQNMPLLLGAVLALLGAATLAHTLVTAIGRRRRDLAVFKTVGFVGRQITGTVAWQATTMVAIALLVGLPLGVAAGRWAWTLLANQIGVVNEPVTPVPPVLLVVPATILLANLIAIAPASLAARIRPALALRAE
jgi:hypothetical protein